MATNLIPITTVTILASAVPDTRTRRPTAGNKQWWSPLVGWSTDPDYIDASAGDKGTKPTTQKTPARSDNAPTRSAKFTPGCFTEEKAKQLRLMTKDTAASHEMYHSAIASRLASDFSSKRNQ